MHFNHIILWLGYESLAVKYRQLHRSS